MLAVSSVLGNRQSLDGGAMFGNVPRALWQRWCPADELGRIELACRAFLVQDDDKTILVEAGVGAFFPPHLAERYGVVEPHHQLLISLEELGVTHEQIDVVVLSHLHFDHAGGILSAFEQGQAPRLLFPKAQFLVGSVAYERACAPHPRDRASFVPELVSLLRESDRLQLIAEGQTSHPLLGERARLFTSHGHTPGMLLTTFMGHTHSATFCADLIPGAPWVHVPVTMGYDRYPELLIDEKVALYEALGVGSWLLFTHESHFAAGRLARDERGKYFLDATREPLVHWDLDA